MSERRRYLEARPEGAVRLRGTLLLIHAFPLNARMWEAQLALSAGGWRIIAPQLRGFDGGADAAVESMDDYAADLIDLLDELHIDDAVIGGLSLGGYVALALFRRAPQYFKGLILSDTRAEADTPEAREGRTKMLALVREHGPAAVADQMIPKLLAAETVNHRQDLVERVRGLVLANDTRAIEGALAAMMTRKDATDLLGSVRCPTLVLVGEHDTLTPPALAERLQQAIPGAARTVIARAGHLPNLEQPDAFNRAVAEFLERKV
jgi:pimeloyl-ACP methyl ester carboxylesterase